MADSEEIAKAWPVFAELITDHQFSEAATFVEGMLEQFASTVDPQAEHSLAQMVGSLAEQAEPFGPFALNASLRFGEIFPESLHPASVFASLIFAKTGRWDLATVYARDFLFKVHNRNALATWKPGGVLQKWSTRAFLLLTSTYTGTGARSYSLRVLAEAQRFDLAESRLGDLQAEQKRLADELQDPEINSLDHAWEQFFSTGMLASACRTQLNNYPIHGARIELLQDHFRFGLISSIPNFEMYVPITFSEEGGQSISQFAKSISEI
jgi:hypothetical protein